MFSFIVRLVILIFVVANPNLTASYRKQLLSLTRHCPCIHPCTPEVELIKPPIANSDRNDLSLRRLLPNCTKPTAPVWRADFDKANRLLADIDSEQLLDTPDINQALQSWENAFKTTLETCIPKGVVPTCMNLPWLSKNLKRAMHNAETLYSEGQSHQDQLSSGENIKACVIK